MNVKSILSLLLLSLSLLTGCAMALPVHEGHPGHSRVCAKSTSENPSPNNRWGAQTSPRRSEGSSVPHKSRSLGVARQRSNRT